MSKLKRMAAPKFWPIQRKTKKYAVMPSAGPHSKNTCIPLGIVLRDVINAAENMKESKEILNSGIVSVNGRRRKSPNFPAGLMDVVAVGDQNYRVLTNKKGLYLHGIESREASIKLSRIENKRHLRKGKLQLSLHDGSNIISEKPCSTGDVLVMSVPDSSVKELVRLEKNSTVLVTAGHNIGKVGRVVDIRITRTPQPNQVVVELGGKSVSIPKKFVFPVGKDKPVINMGV